jgi:NADPH2:quinone reductase
MKAVRVHYGGESSSLAMDEVSMPEPGPGQLLIKTMAIGMNRADLGRRRTAPPGQPEPPAIPGLDVGGTIEALGPGVTGWRRGEAVIALTRSTYAEYVLAKTVTTYRPPLNVPLVTAASIPCVFLTAWYGLAKLGGLKAGETALIHAAGSGVGMAGIQIAKNLGARVLTSAGSAERVKRGIGLGAEAGVDYSAQDVAAELRRLTNGRGVDVVLDSVGGPVFDASLKALAPGGRIVTVGAPAGQRSTVDEASLSAQGQSIKACSVFREAEEDTAQAGWAQLKAWFEQVKLRSLVQQVLPWTQAEAAQKLLNDRSVFGKLVMTV